MARTAKRPRLDWGLRLVLAGAMFLAPATVVGLCLAFDVVAGPRLALAYAVLTLGGWASLSIAGMMLKIVPFLVWYRAYSPYVGRAPVPTLGQLSWPAGEALAFVLLAVGMATLAVAATMGEVPGLRAAGVIVAAGALAFGATLARVIGHLRSTPALTPPAASDQRAGRGGPRAALAGTATR
jgi:hypothetical protein